MAKQIEDWSDTYDPQAFAEKHGLTLRQAKIVISSNGPSKHACDVGAIAFRRALAMCKSKPALRLRQNPQRYVMKASLE